MGGKVYPNQISPSSKNSKPTTLYFDPKRYHQIKVIAAIEQKSATDIIHEAIDMLLATKKHILKQTDKIEIESVLKA